MAEIGKVVAVLRDAEEGDAASSAAEAAKEHGENTLQTTAELARMSSELTGLVSTFRY